MACPSGDAPGQLPGPLTALGALIAIRGEFIPGLSAVPSKDAEQGRPQLSMAVSAPQSATT